MDLWSRTSSSCLAKQILPCSLPLKKNQSLQLQGHRFYFYLSFFLSFFLSFVLSFFRSFFLSVFLSFFTLSLSLCILRFLCVSISLSLSICSSSFMFFMSSFFDYIFFWGISHLCPSLSLPVSAFSVPLPPVNPSITAAVPLYTWVCFCLRFFFSIRFITLECAHSTLKRRRSMKLRIQRSWGCAEGCAS